MSKNEFIIDAKNWLSDPHIIMMDWDCKGIHLHLLCLAAQQNPKGHLLDEDKIFLKIFTHLNEEDWKNRIKPQLLNVWKNVVLEKNGISQKYIFSDIFSDKIEKPKKTRKPKDPELSSNTKKSNLEVFTENENQGFRIEDILKLNNKTTILFEHHTEEDNNSIWKIGVSLLESQGKTEPQARAFIAKLIKSYGAKSVANAFVQVSLKNTKPADISSYVIWFLKQEDDIKKTTNSRGRVSI